MPTITVNVDETLKKRMEDHPEINWSEVTRQAIEAKIEKLDVLDELSADSELTAEDVEELAKSINENARNRLDRDAE